MATDILTLKRYDEREIRAVLRDAADLLDGLAPQLAKMPPEQRAFIRTEVQRLERALEPVATETEEPYA